MSNKTAEDIKSAMSGISNFFSYFTGTKRGERDKYFNNPNSIYDEVNLIAWFIVFAVVSIVSYFGIDYHYSIFENDGNRTAVIISIGVLLLGEIIKVKLGYKYLLLLATGELKKGKDAVLIIIAMSVVLYFTYKWSYDISASAFGGNKTSLEKLKIAKGQEGVKGIKESYDLRLKQIDSDIATAKKQTWDGKIVPKAMQSIKESKEERKKVLALIDKEMNNSIKSDSTMLSLEFERIANNEKRLNDYGGKCEILMILMLIISVLCKLRIDQETKGDEKDEKIEGDTIEQNSQKGIGFKTIAPLSQNTVTQNQRNPIGFKQNNSEKIVIIEPNVISFDEKKKIN
jgi:hypothetical protein